MLSLRGLCLVAGSLVLALVGIAYGVEEFVLVASAGATLLVAGVLMLGWQVHRARSALRVEVGVPPTQVNMDRGASLVVEGSGRSARCVPELWLEATRHWQVSFPGLGVRRLPQAAPTWSTIPGRRGVRRILGLGPERDAWLAVPALAPGARWRVPVAVPTRSRGLWTLAPIGVWCTDPLGLLQWRVASSPAAQVVVLPRALAPEASSAVGREPTYRRLGQDAEPSSEPTGGSGDEFAGIRPYEPGDRLTRLHWPAMARTGELLTRAFDEFPGRRLVLLLDTRPAQVDRSVSAAAGAGAAALADGITVELQTPAGERATVVPGPAGEATLLYLLALVAPAVPIGSLAASRGSLATPTGSPLSPVGCALAPADPRPR